MTGFIRTYFGLDPLHRPRADPADRALRDGRHPDRCRRAACSPTARPPSCPASTRRASAPASASTARTGSGRTRCSTSSSSGDARGSTWPATCATRRSAVPDLAAEASVQAAMAGLLGATDGERPADDSGRAPGGHVHQVRRVPHRAAADRVRATRSPPCASARRTCSSTTRAAATTPTSARRSSSATCSTAPRRRWPPRSPAREPRRARARGLPERDDVDWLRHSLAFRRRRWRPAAARLQAGDAQRVRAQGRASTRVAHDGRPAAHPPLQPRARPRAALGGVHGSRPSRPTGSSTCSTR